MAWNLEQLRSFVAAAERGSFSAAARASGRAQSAISTHVALLEAELGVELFRRGHTPRLTEAGAALLAEAREILRRCRCLDERALALCRQGMGELRLGVDEGLPFPSVVTVFVAFAKAFPLVQVQMLNVPSGEIDWWMTEGGTQAGIVFEGACAGLAALETYPLGSVEQVLVASEEHPLAGEVRITRDELSRYRQIVIRSAVGEARPDMVLSPVHWETNSYYAAAELAGRGIGWAVLPVSVALEEKLPPGLRILRQCDVRFPALNMALVWKSGALSESVRIWLREALSRALRAP